MQDRKLGPNQLSSDNINDLVGYLGIPYIRTLEKGINYPQSTKKRKTENEASADVLELITQEAVFSYMTKPRADKLCPLYYMCRESEYKKDECFGAPWEGAECSFTIVSTPPFYWGKTLTGRMIN